MQQAMAEDSIVSRASCPCPPWAYGVTVWPGPTWEFDGQNVVRGKVALGVTKVPDDDTLQEWSDYVIDAARSGYWREAGWAPHRSSWVEWGPEESRPGTGPMYFYKSGDEGAYDLNYSPDQETINVAECAVSMFTCFHKWLDLVEKKFKRVLESMPDTADTADFELNANAAMDLAAAHHLEVQMQIAREMEASKFKPNKDEEAQEACD